MQDVSELSDLLTGEIDAWCVDLRDYDGNTRNLCVDVFVLHTRISVVLVALRVASTSVIGNGMDLVLG